MREQLKFLEPIRRWDEAIPLGNGRVGCLIWGTAQALRFGLDRTDIWDLSVPKNTDAPEFTYQNLVRLAHMGDTDEIRRIFDAPYQYPAPTKLPAGGLVLCFQGASSVASSLDIERAQATVLAGVGERRIKIEAICHALNGTGMIRAGAPRQEFSVELQNPQFGCTEEAEMWTYDPNQREISQGSLKNLHYPPVQKERRSVSETLELLRYIQPAAAGFSYGVIAAIRQMQESTLIFWRIISSRDGEEWIAENERLLCGQISQGYEVHVRTHRDWWSAYWGKSSVKLPDALAKRQWDMTNYLFASCSRKGCYPMPLQGVWTADDGCLPPWKGDYHNDLNTQLCYSHFFKANHLEEGESFLDFLWSLRPAAARFAKNFYGTDGICLPGVMTIDGKPLGGWPMYSLSPTQQIWLCQSFDLYYQYTGDRRFLAERAWVYLRETALCITELLQLGEDGKYYLPVSSSPEIHDDEAKAWVTPNSNYDLALLRYLYQRLTDYAKELGLEKERLRWKEILEKLPELAVDEKGVLLLAPDEALRESHRHLSNAMAICPLHLIGYQTPEERRIVDAVIADYERLGTGMWVGFSFCWMSHLYAVQGNGEGAWEQLRIFWESFCSINGFHLNGDYKNRGYSSFHYRPFTLEANMYAADALQEMLLQTQEGRIRLFPAVPQAWKKKELAFSGFRAVGGIIVSAGMENGRLVSLELHASREQEIIVEGSCLKEEMRVRLKAGKIWRWRSCERSGGMVEYF